MFRQDTTCPALLFVGPFVFLFKYRAFTFYGFAFQQILLRYTNFPQLGCSAFARRYLQNLG